MPKPNVVRFVANNLLHLDVPLLELVERTPYNSGWGELQACQLYKISDIWSGHGGCRRQESHIRLTACWIKYWFEELGFQCPTFGSKRCTVLHVDMHLVHDYGA